MDLQTPFIQEEGRGEAVVCLHSNASTSSQWRQLSTLLSDRFCIRAADSYGAGQSPEWPPSTRSTFDAEVDFLYGALRGSDEPFHLVGHSYGAAVALQLAVRYPQRVLSIAVYEPTLFYLVAGENPSISPAAGISHACADAAASVRNGDDALAAERFIDFWMKPGSWREMPAKRQDAVARSVRNVARWRDATFTPAASATAFAALQIPVLLMWGDRSPESAQSVARLLAATMAQVTPIMLQGLGHMGPITDSERVNEHIASFLNSHRSQKT